MATFRALFAAAIVAAGLFGAPLAYSADAQITVLTGRTSGVYYPLGVALANAIDGTLPNVRTAVQATKGSVEALTLLEAGRGEIAFTLGDALSDAWKGNEAAGFWTPLHRLRGIAAIYPNFIHLVARADSGIRTLADLKGKRISVGPQKSGTELNARAILGAAGLSYRDFAKVEYLPFGESVEVMKNRQVDVILQSAGLGASSLRDLANAVDVVVVPIPPEVIAKVNDPAYLPAVIPANTYRGQSRDVRSASLQNYLVTHEGVSNETAYGMTKALWTSLDRLVAANSAAKGIDVKKALDGLPVPLHPGAEKYYRDIGVIK